MTITLRHILILSFAILAGCTPVRDISNCQPADGVNYVWGGTECMAIQTYLPENPDKADTLMIVLHGDMSRGGSADYIFPVARYAAEQGAIGIAMMRVGYPGAGRRSSGISSRMEHAGDLYTFDEVDAVAAATATLKEHYGTKRVTMFGHSGGAATAGVILGRHPGLLDGALLYACPCNIPRWRQMRGRSAWPRAESPHTYLTTIPSDTIIRLVVGAEDTNTFPLLSQEYAEEAVALGLNARTDIMPGLRHGFRRALLTTDTLKKSMDDILLQD